MGAGERDYIDVVLRGGAASGALYPSFLGGLSQHFALRNLAGTSAGAIGIACGAAAEYRRLTTGSSVGFEALAKLVRGLADGRLLALLEPWPEVADLWRAVWRPDSCRPRRWLGVVGAVAAAVAAGRPWRWRDRGWGLCPGGAFTQWLYEALQEVSGRTLDGPSLTFGDYTGHRRADDHGSQLAMMTTCLSLGRPFALPLRDRWYWYDEDQLAPLVGAGLIASLRRASPGEPTHWQGRALRRLPRPEDWPLALGARLSMALPVVLSAVPLWQACRHSRTDRQPTAFRLLWFSDGGLCSNQPLHCFDSLAPRWPAVAVELHHCKASRTRADVYLHGGARRGQRLPWRELTGWADFGSSMLEAACGWHDALMTTLPGQRDGLVHIWLAPGEGRMNLRLGDAQLERLRAKGERAATLVQERFGSRDGKPADGWRAQRWAQLITALSLLERATSELVETAAEKPCLESLAARPPCYRRYAGRARRSHGRLWSQRGVAKPGEGVQAWGPKPESRLLVVPRL